MTKVMKNLYIFSYNMYSLKGRVDSFSVKSTENYSFYRISVFLQKKRGNVCDLIRGEEFAKNWKICSKHKSYPFCCFELTARPPRVVPNEVYWRVVSVGKSGRLMDKSHYKYENHSSAHPGNCAPGPCCCQMADVYVSEWNATKSRDTLNTWVI